MNLPSRRLLQSDCPAMLLWISWTSGPWIRVNDRNSQVVGKIPFWVLFDASVIAESEIVSKVGNQRLGDFSQPFREILPPCSLDFSTYLGLRDSVCFPLRIYRFLESCFWLVAFLVSLFSCCQSLVRMHARSLVRRPQCLSNASQGNPVFPMPHKVTQCYPVPHKATQCYPVPHKATQCYPVPHKATQCYPMPSQGNQCCSMPHKVTQCCQCPPRLFKPSRCLTAFSNNTWNLIVQFRPFALSRTVPGEANQI